MVLIVKNPPANAGDTGNAGLVPGLGRSPAGEHGNPLPNVLSSKSLSLVGQWSQIMPEEAVPLPSTEDKEAVVHAVFIKNEVKSKSDRVFLKWRPQARAPLQRPAASCCFCGSHKVTATCGARAGPPAFYSGDQVVSPPRPVSAHAVREGSRRYLHGDWSV